MLWENSDYLSLNAGQCYQCRHSNFNPLHACWFLVYLPAGLRKHIHRDAYADCTTGFGDVLSEGIHMRPNGFNLLAVVLFMLAGFAVMVMTVEINSRHREILGGLG